MPLSLDLTGRVVLVVGAGSSGAGLSNGEAAALAYAEAGATVVALDQDAGEAQRVAAEVAARGGEALAVTADVTDETQVERAVAETVAAFGTPSVLHHNVGAVRPGAVTELDLAGWEGAFRLNVTSAYLTTRHVLPLMLEAGHGVVTTVSSVAAIRSTGYVYPAYNASKAALDQLTVSLALTYADRGVRANAILPGLIDTPLVAAQLAQDPGALAARHAASPTGRMGSPWDVARVAVFLASDAASYVNGVCLPVDGGLSARCL